MWLQKAFSLAEHLDDTLTAGAAELKVRSRYYRALWLIVSYAVSAVHIEKFRSAKSFCPVFLTSPFG
jgi:hypothetical protein